MFKKVNYFLVLMFVFTAFISTHGEEKKEFEWLVEPKYDYIGGAEGNNIKYYKTTLNKKAGLIDNSGKIIIEPKYDEIGTVRENVFTARLGDKWGCVDLTGDEVVKIKYDKTEACVMGLIPVKLNGKWGVVDNTGKEIASIRYDEVVRHGSYNSDIYFTYLKKDDKYSIIDPYKKKLDNASYDAIHVSSVGCSVKLNGKWGALDNSGKLLTPIKYDTAFEFFDVYSFTSDWKHTKSETGISYARVKMNGKYGFIDSTGKEITPIKYDFAQNCFWEGMTNIVINKKWGFVDISGKEVISPLYESANGFRDGLATVKLGEKWGAVDKSGNLVIPIKYDSPLHFCEGLSPAKINGKFGYINKSDKAIVQAKYDYGHSFNNGMACVKLNNKIGFIDLTGKEIIPIVYNSTEHVSDDFPSDVDFKSLAINDDWYVINKSGELIFKHDITGTGEIYKSKKGFINLNEKRDIYGCLSNYLFVKVWDKQRYLSIKGIIDKNGEIIIPAIYDEIYPFNVNDIAAAKLNGKWGFIDIKNNVVIPFEFDGVGHYQYGLLYAKKDGKWGVIKNPLTNKGKGK